MTDLAQAMVEHFEGCELSSYLDTKGIPTIGWGHTGPGVFYPGMTCTQEEADAWLEADMAQARADALRFPDFGALNDVRQAVLVSMAYQLGAGPLYWPNFMASLKAQDYTAAASNGLDSVWAKETPARAQSEMAMLASGEWELS